MSDMTYWFATNNISGIESKIREIVNKYSELVRCAMAISDVMKEYVNAPGKWNDDNSVVLAQWWNRDGSNSGNLESDPENGLRIIASETGGIYDGEDRIRGILNRSAYLFWVVVCRPMYSIVSNQYEATRGSFSSIMNTCYEMGKNSIDNGNFTSNAWGDFMNSLAADSTSIFKSTMLPVENADGGSNDGEISNFMQNMSNRIHGFVDALNAYIASIKPVMEDSPTTCQFFGLYPNSAAEEARNGLMNISNDHINDFQNNLSTAISGYSGEVSNQISQYLSTTYNVR